MSTTLSVGIVFRGGWCIAVVGCRQLRNTIAYALFIPSIIIYGIQHKYLEKRVRLSGSKDSSNQHVKSINDE